VVWRNPAFGIYRFENLGKNSPDHREQIGPQNPVFFEKMRLRRFENREKPQIRRENVLEQFTDTDKTKAVETSRRLENDGEWKCSPLLKPNDRERIGRELTLDLIAGNAVPPLFSLRRDVLRILGRVPRIQRP
jgi:hypothetical protein